MKIAGLKSNFELSTGEESFFRLAEVVYERYPGHKAVGTYSMGGEASLAILDLELSKRILIKDFESFAEQRSFGVNPKANKIPMYMLSILPFDKWKVVRPLVRLRTNDL